MQVLCKATDKSTAKASDVRCEICGQTFAVFFTRSSAAERAAARRNIAATLRAAHQTDKTPAAHPQEGFNLPAWNGDPRDSAAALIGNAPAWATS